MLLIDREEFEYTAEMISGVEPSSVSVTLPPGRKWLPYRCSVPPVGTSPLPLKEMAGEKIVKKAVMKLVIIRIMTATIMSQRGAQPGAGLGCGGRGLVG